MKCQAIAAALFGLLVCGVSAETLIKKVPATDKCPAYDVRTVPAGVGKTAGDYILQKDSILGISVVSLDMFVADNGIVGVRGVYTHIIDKKPYRFYAYCFLTHEVTYIIAAHPADEKKSDEYAKNMDAIAKSIQLDMPKRRDKDKVPDPVKPTK